MAKEIERKWLIKDMPKIDRKKCIDIQQGYLVSEGDSEVRIRKSDKKYTLTVKKGSGMVRDEVEIAIGKATFDDLWERTEGKRIYKVRHFTQYEDMNVEIDIYAKNLLGLHVMEVEFKSEEDAIRFKPPDWAGKEITADKRYHNRTLASSGMPK
jgi:adenylate cyclase